jgi:hypothetical protein
MRTKHWIAVFTVALAATLAICIDLADTVHAATISTYLNAYVADQTGVTDYQQYAEGLPQALTPTSYTASVTNGGGVATSNATVSLGTLHSSQSSSFSLRSSPVGDAQGYVDIFVDDTGHATSTTINPTFTLTGSLSAVDGSGDSYSYMLMTYTVLDHTNGTQTQSEINTSSGQNVVGGILNTALGDSIEYSIVFEIFAYQDNAATVSPAFADYSHTLNYYLTNFSSNSGYDYSPVTATPLPAAFPLFASGLGALGLLGWRRKRKTSAALAA